jgi:hypothetical protein
MDPQVHKRFLDYRESYLYFGQGGKLRQLGAEEFTAADAEYRALEEKGEARDDEEEERLVDLAALLFRD